MKLSLETHKKFEEFFREYFEDENFQMPQTEIYLKRGAGIITRLLSVDGITLGRYIFIRPSIAKYKSQHSLTINKNLLAHELAHVLQYQRLGFIRFLVDYLREYWRGIKRKKKFNSRARMESYWEISHEVEARIIAEKFVEWNMR